MLRVLQLGDPAVVAQLHCDDRHARQPEDVVKQRPLPPLLGTSRFAPAARAISETSRQCTATLHEASCHSYAVLRLTSMCLMGMHARPNGQCCCASDGRGMCYSSRSGRAHLARQALQHIHPPPLSAPCLPWSCADQSPQCPRPPPHTAPLCSPTACVSAHPCMRPSNPQLRIPSETDDSRGS